MHEWHLDLEYVLAHLSHRLQESNRHAQRYTNLATDVHDSRLNRKRMRAALTTPQFQTYMTRYVHGHSTDIVLALGRLRAAAKQYNMTARKPRTCKNGNRANRSCFQPAPRLALIPDARHAMLYSALSW